MVLRIFLGEKMTEPTEMGERELDKMARTISLNLDPRGGRVFANHATLKDSDPQSIELKCHLDSGFMMFGTEVIIGEDEHPWHDFFADDDDDQADRHKDREPEKGWRLSSIPVMVTIYKATPDWVCESAAERGGETLAGRLSYAPKMNTADGVVSDKWPTCFVWIALGPEVFRLVRDRVINFEKYDFKLGLSVLFPKEAVNSSWTGRTVRWDGKGNLDVESATVVWSKEDWRSDTRQPVVPRQAREAAYVAPREHVEVLDGQRRIEAGLKALLIPLWALTGAVVTWMVWHH
jgi:hypothetical protein